MALFTLKGQPFNTTGQLPALHTKAPPFTLVDRELHSRTLQEFHGKWKLLATVPSLDTATCSTMTRHLNEWAKKHPHCVVLTVSADLPFAQKRFCEAEQTHNVVPLSMMRDKEFGKSYGLLIQEGPLAGLLARALFVLDEKDHILWVELVSELTREPDYHKAFAVVPAKK